jgi:PAS domain S-box-containing protein
LLTLAGITLEEGMGHTWIRTIHPDDRERVLAAASRAATEQRELSQEYRILTRTKEECWVHTTATAIRSPEGEVTGYVGTIENITERRLAEEEKHRAYESIVMLLATAAEARDPYTERHLFRIRGFAEAIAAETGLPSDEIAAIGSASLLHDLGKIRIPDSILTKPGPLTENEWRIIKQHPLWGEELLSGYPWLETARHIARWHHEAWAGNGYPDGLRGEEIPLSAAIVAVADCLDALISDRPYKKAWPSQRAVKEIQSQSGKKYSPEVIDAFNRALHKGMIKRIAATDFDLPHLSRAA